MKINSAQARSIVLSFQLYRFSEQTGKAGVLDVIKSLSYVQIDTISVIQRAHHHTLYNRVNDYHPELLNDLLAKDKAVWEYWAHAAAYIPIEDYSYYKIRMQNFPNGNWEKKLWDLHRDMEKSILDRIKKEGPLSTKDFEDTRLSRSNEPWGNVKPAKLMLELLMWKGDLIITARDKFQRVYDLTERVIPNYREVELPGENARAEFMILRTLQAHGLATENDINNHIKLASRQTVARSLKNLMKRNKIIKIGIAEAKDNYYMLADTKVPAEQDCKADHRVRILSPFDNAVILRPRLQKIFGFDYALECYVTPAKRKFGYWNCPILWKDNFTGILDPKTDRKSKTLTINSIFIDKKVWKQKTFQTAFEQEVTNFARFNGCNTYSINKLNLV